MNRSKPKILHRVGKSNVFVMRKLVITLFIITSLHSFNTYSASSEDKKLYKAVFRDNLIDAQKVIDDGGNVNEHSTTYCSPLMDAVLMGNEKMVGLLLKNGAKSDTCPELHSIFIYGYKVFNPSDGSKIEISGRQFLYTPFYYSIKTKRIDIVKLFCDNGYDITKKIGGKQFTYPIIASAKFDDTPIFNLLIEKGVDVKMKDYLGENALMYSASASNVEITNKLLDKGCPVNDTSRIGYTSLMYAAETPGINTEIINSLINSGADLNYNNSLNLSAFSIACFHNKRELALFLFEHGAKEKDIKSGFELNAKMNHFLGDYFLAKGELKISVEYYKKAKQFYNESIPIEQNGLSSVNRAKTSNFIIGALTGAAISSLSAVQANQFGKNIGMNLNNSQKTLIASSYADSYNNTFQKVYTREPFIIADIRYPISGDLDELKAFYKNKIKQIEMSINLIDNILSCIEKGLTGQELKSCIDNIQLSKK